MHGSTQKMAHAVAEGAISEGADVKVIIFMKMSVVKL